MDWSHWLEQVWVAVGSAVVYLTLAVLAVYGFVYLWAVLVLAGTWLRERRTR